MGFHVTCARAHYDRRPLRTLEYAGVTTYDVPLRQVVDLARSYVSPTAVHRHSELRNDDKGRVQWVVAKYWQPDTNEQMALTILLPECLGASSRGRVARYLVKRM